MVELANPGVSGSIFYVTRDDNFICKTVQHKEAGGTPEPGTDVVIFKKFGKENVGLNHVEKNGHRTYNRYKHCSMYVRTYMEVIISLFFICQCI
jgi:hypothetical protein